MDTLKATLPSLEPSGEQKIRALWDASMNWTQKNGVYAGEQSALSATRDMDLLLAIRTTWFKNQRAYMCTLGQIVYDSIAQNEYQETINKAKNLWLELEN